jgi:hypothetical protein
MNMLHGFSNCGECEAWTFSLELPNCIKKFKGETDLGFVRGGSQSTMADECYIRCLIVWEVYKILEAIFYICVGSVNDVVKKRTYSRKKQLSAATFLYQSFVVVYPAPAMLNTP